MLKLIVSPPGAGKTTFITEYIKEDAKKRSKNPSVSAPLLIVPEQFHFETERYIYKQLGARNAGSCDVVSFTKLGSVIIGKSGKKAYANDTVREITMLKVIRELKNSLLFYGRSAEKPDIACRMLGITEMFQREGVSHERLEQAHKACDSMRLKRKLSDIAAIYELYNKTLSEKFSDKFDEIRIAAELAEKNGYFSGKNVYIDGFDGFSGGQLLMLEVIIKQAENVYITLLSDKIPTKTPHYITSAKLADKLIRIARQKGKTHEVINLLQNPERKPVKETDIFVFSDVFEESDFVASKIRELITEGGYSLNEIAVLNAASPETLSGALSAYGISEFSDIPEPIIEKPFVRFIITVLEAAIDKPGAVLSLIKSGFVRVSEEAAFSVKIKPQKFKIISGIKIYDWTRPENKSYRPGRARLKTLMLAAHMWRLDGKDWHKPFPPFMKTGRLEKAEKTRAEIMGGLSALKEKISGTTGDKITEALTDYLINKMEIGRTVADIVYRSKKGSGENQKVDKALNDEYRQLWETVISVFESMHAALFEQEISAENYTAVLASVFGRTLIAKPPQVLDAVTVGDLRRTRTSGIKVAFIMGANQGELPKCQDVSGEFSENEAIKLSELGAEIFENREQRYYRERFLINKALTLPSERLYITAPLRDSGWKEKQPSAFLNELAKKQGIEIKSGKDLPPYFLANAKNALKFMAAKNPHDKPIRLALEKIDSEENKRIEAALKKGDYLHKIDPDDAKALIDSTVISPSRIERLNTCLFLYFCSAGLKIGSEQVKNDDEPNALIRGNMAHYVLERALSDYSGNDFADFIALTSDSQKLHEVTRDYIKEFENKEFFGGYARTERQKGLLALHAAGISEVLRQMGEDMKLTGFRPFELEKSFNFKLGNTLVKGKTDRTDILKGQDGSYIRVIDYKTGSKDFKLSDIGLGLNWQALLYLFAVTQRYADMKASGAFYRMVNGGRLSEGIKPFGIINPNSESDFYKNRLETQRATGLQFGGGDREDSADIKAVNKIFKKYLVSARKNFINAEYLSEKEFNDLRIKLGEMLQERLDLICGGDVSAVPVLNGSKVYCDYCDYKNICKNAGKFEVRTAESGESEE